MRFSSIRENWMKSVDVKDERQWSRPFYVERDKFFWNFVNVVWIVGYHDMLLV